MAEIGIEDITRAIRERVEAQSQARDGRPPAPGREMTEQLGRIETHLSVTARTRDRLPPIMTYRYGWPARIELWIKRQLKRATHWYTWEQVNFNTAVYEALKGVGAALTTQAQHLAKLQERLDAGPSELTASQSQLDTLSSRLTSLEGRFAALLADEFEKLRDEQRRQNALARDEQRVCLRQMALEISETAALADRARRSLQARFDELAKQFEELHAVRTEVERLRRPAPSRHDSP